MKIHKWIEHSEEIAIDLSPEDIHIILEETGKVEHLIYNLNSISHFLEGVPDNLIAKMMPKTKEVIANFFIKQAARYNERKT